MNEQTIVKEEFIGSTVTIPQCTDPTWVGALGVILDETKHTFLIEIENKQKRLAKHIAFFEFNQNGKKIQVDGARLGFRPEDRIKKAR